MLHARMRPSETRAGRAWLGNFHATDVDAATVLIDSLRFVTLSTLRTKLRELLDRLVADEKVATPVFVLPERKLEHFGVSEVQRTTAVAWLDFQPGAPVSVTPGSDGFVGMILRDFARAGDHRHRPDDTWIAPDADIEELRDARCRSIFIVTDFVGTGRQVEDLARSLAQHPTIRSWRSLHLVTIHVAAFAAQRSGLERLHTSRWVDHAHIVETAPTLKSKITDQEARERVEQLCLTYCQLRRSLALGYGESGGLFVTERGAPNNIPAILWQGRSGWFPLFPWSQVPEDFASELGEHRTAEGLEALALRVGQARLGRNVRLGSMRSFSRDLLQVLTLNASGTTGIPAVADAMSIDVLTAEALSSTLAAWGFVDASGRITAEGRSELAEHRHGLRVTTAQLAGSDEPYYPVGLR